MRFIKIDSLGEIITGKTPSTKNKSFYNGPYPFITPTDLNDSIHVHTSSTISEAGAATQLGTIISKNSVCFTCIASIGKMCITERPSITNQQINSIIVNQEKYDYRYVYYLLRYHTSHIAAIAIGSATPIISKARFSEILLPVETDISIQHTIADILSAYDDLIENNQKQIKLLEEAAQRLYKEWFVDLRFPGWENTKIVDGVPEGWTVTTLDDVIDFDPKVPLSKDRIKQFVPMSALSTNSMCLNLNEITFTQSNSGSKFQNGDTLLARITPCLENGKTAFVSGIISDEGAVGSTEYIVMRSKKLNPYMVYLLARTNDFRQAAINSMSGSDGRQRAKVDKLKCLPYLLPLDNIIQKSLDLFKPIFSNIESLSIQSQRLDKIKNMLLSKLMNDKAGIL